MTDIYTTEIHVPDGKQVEITTRNSPSWIIPFHAIGKPKRHQPDSLDGFGHICDFSKPELFLLREVFSLRDVDNKVTLRLKSYSAADQARLKRARLLWIRKGLLKRIKRERYMVNPWFLVPPKEEQLIAVGNWSLL